MSVSFLSYWLLLRRRGEYVPPEPLLGADPVGDAVAEGVSAGLGERGSSAEARLRAQHARNAAFADGNPANAMGVLLSLVRNYPADGVLQRITARVLIEIGDATRAVTAWEGIVSRFPNSRENFVGLVGAVARRSGPGAAGSLIAARRPATFDEFVTIADAWETIGASNEADEALETLTTRFKDRDDAWTAAISWLETRGFYRRAAMLLRHALTSSPQPRRYGARLAEVEGFVDRLPAEISRPRERRSLAVLSGLFADLVAARNEVVPTDSPAAGPVVMVIGGLGAGGSERQLLYTAQGLRASSRGAERRIIVVAESCRSRKTDGFFRPQLEAAGVPVFEYEELPLFGGRYATSAARTVVDALRFLPTPMLESVLRLADALRQWRTEVVQIWQETTVYEAGLAALLARVPRIILCLRSVPAIDRPGRYRPQYPVIFNALLAASNVDLSCNSRSAAIRYAQWLGIDPARITIIPNGAEKLPPDGDATSEARFRKFEALTGPSRLTVGALMRMDENKRPQLWVEVAARLLEQVPSARFILVGDGRLRQETTRWVVQRGIAKRFLFVGLSRNVGFWLAKMDLFMLLSKQEGLPNALIEAQLSGVPVVVTPAGGVSEAMVPGLTGIVTGPDPSVEDIAAQVLSLVDNPDRLREMGEAGVQWASSAFSMAQMVRRSLALIDGDRCLANQPDVTAAGAASCGRATRRANAGR